MNFNVPLLRPIRILLFPFSLVYGTAVVLRNFLYNKKLISTTSFNLPVICIGNLSVGGTGKSPMVEFLLKNLSTQFKIAVLSRGYKRKTKGYALVRTNSTALEMGDEPMLFKMKFPDVDIAVGEERIFAIPQLLHDKPETQVIILDDAFQHRQVKAGLNILLTEFNNLYTRDWFLPTGDLRDETQSADRADLIIVTKSPSDLAAKAQLSIKKELHLAPHQKLFFTSLRYGKSYHIISKEQTNITPDHEILLVTGIANPAPIKDYLLENADTYYEMNYNDHHIFTIDDLREIRQRFDSITTEKKMIITTEKDAVRLMKFQQELKNLPLYVLPVEHHFLNGEAQSFLHLITNFIQTFKR